MKAERVVHERLTTHVGVQALVDARVYPVVLPQEAIYPCLSFKRVDSKRYQGVYTDPGYATVTIQVTAYAKTYEEVKALAEEVRLALERYGSSLTGTEIAGVIVYDMKLGTEADAYEPPPLDLFTHSTDITVLHAE